MYVSKFIDTISLIYIGIDVKDILVYKGPFHREPSTKVNERRSLGRFIIL